jgi:hypothetical protein
VVIRTVIWILLIGASSLSFAQTEPPQFMTVDGRLYDSTTPEDPLLDNSVLMKIQILNPAKTCILYEEEQTVSTLASNGYFNVRIGSPTSGGASLKRTTFDSGNSMMLVFQNQSASITGRTSGGGGCSYSPAAGDTRYFRYIITPSTTGVTSTLNPDMQIDSVPQSLVAETLQGMSPDDFVQINSDVTQAKVNGLFGASYAGLTGLLAGSSSLYLQNTTNGTVIPSRATNPVAPTAGQIWYDSDDFVMRYYDGTSVLTLGTGGADPTKLPLAGGAMTGAIDMGTNDITNVGHITQAPQRTLRFGLYTTAQQATLIATPLIAGHEGTVWYNTTTNKLMFWDGTAAFAVSPVDSVFGRTGAVVAAASDYDAVQIDNTPAGTIAATEVQGAINELDSEKVAKAGDTMTGQLNMGPKGVAAGDGGAIAFTELAASGTNTATIRSPDALGANYVLTLPPNDGDSGQYLQTDGNGVLAWVTPAGVGETNTASNQGVGGVGFYDAKSGVDLQFRNLNAASNKVSVALDAGNREVDINVNEANFNSAAIPNTAAGTIAATNVQAAINELDTDKVATTRAINTAAGSGLAGGGDLSADRSLSVNINGTTAETVVAGADEILIYDASATALRKMTRANFVLSEAEVDAMVSNNGFLSSEADTLATVTGRGATTATNITLDTQAQARFADSAGGEYAAIQAPATIGTNYVLTLPDSAGTNGQVLSTNGSGVLSWIAIPSAPVTTVFGRSGAVVAAASDYDANQIDNTPAGSISATEVQAAINELDTEKVAKAGDTMTGALNIDNEQELRLSEADGSGANYVAIKALTTLGANYTLTLPPDDGNSGQYLQTDGNGVLAWVTPAGVGETNTASNQGVGGVGVFKQKTTFDLEFRNINAASNKISVALDAGNNEIDINVAEANLDSAAIPNTAAGTIAATNVQAAINELDTDKVATTRAINTAAGSGLTGGGDLSADRSLSVNINGTTAETVVAGTDEILIYDASATALRKMTRTNFVLSEAEVDAMVSNNGFLSTEADTLATVTGRGASTATSITMNTQAQIRYADSAGGEYAAIQAPATIGTNYILTLPDTAGSASQVLTTNGSGVLSWTTPASAGEVNTASNQGVAGVGLYDAKSGADLQFRNINAASNKVSVALDAGNKEVDINVNEANFNLASIPNTAAGNIAAVTAQAAINELDAEKVAKAGDTMTGALNIDNEQELRLSEADGSGANYVAIKALTTLGANYTLTLPPDDGNSGQYLQTDGNGVLAWVTPAGVGETNTASNQGVGGVGVFKQKTTFDLEFRNINAASNKISVALDAGNNEIDINVAEANLDLGAIPNTPAGTIAAITAQTAINELDTEKVAKAGDSMTGALTFNTQNQARFADSAGGEYAAIQAPTTIGTNYVLTLPDTAGSASQVLTTNGSGVLSWTTPSTTPGADSLDFTHFADSMTLDANTDIAVGANVLSITNDGVGNSFVVNDNGAADTTPFVINASGNVGIGTTSPASRLHLYNNQAGNGSTVGPLFVDRDATTNEAGIWWGTAGVDRWFFGMDNDGTNDFVVYNGTTSNYVFKIDDATDNIGIGTTAPGSRLDVAGALTSRPFGTGAGQTGQLIMRELAAGGSETATIRAPDALGASYALTLPVDDGTSGQVLSTDGNGVLSWIAPGSTITADSLNFTDLADALVLDASTDISVTGTDVFSITNSGTGNSFVVNDQAGDSSPFVVNNAGFVGVGTSNPQRLLHLQISDPSTPTMLALDNTNTANFSGASIGWRGPTTGTGAASFQTFSYINSLFLQHDHATKASSMQFYTSAAGSTNVRMIIDQNTFVGVGDISPLTRLDVDGQITSRPFGANTGETGQITFRELAANGANTATIRAPDTLALNYALTLPVDDGTAGQVLSTDGNGILSWIAAGSTISADSLNFTDFADALVLDASTDISVTGTNVFSITNTGTGNSFRVNDETTDTTPFVIDDSGRVGVGTTAPNSTLHVLRATGGDTGNFETASGWSRLNVNSPDANAMLTLRGGSWNWNLTNDFSLGGDLRFSRESTEMMIITDSGSVGIGTTVPGTLLDVAGAITSRPSGTGTGQTGQLIMRELAAGGSETATIRAPDALGASYALTLPVDDGTAGQVLSTDGNGILSWIAPGSTISADSLNFTDLADALVLDASTDIAVGTNVLSVTNDGAGNTFVVNDNGSGDTTPFVIDASGNVGVGTATASTKLHVATSSSTVYAATGAGISPSGSSGSVMVQNSSATSGSGSYLRFSTLNATSTDNTAYIGAISEAADSSPAIVFGSRDVGGVSSYSERMRVDSGGNVGIGTTEPGTLLDVAGAITSRPFGAGAGQTGQLIMRELAAGGSETATIRAPDALGASYALTLPIDDGTSGQVLSTDGNGILSWIAPGSTISADSLNFTDLADALVLDASTDISATGTNVLSITNSGTGSSFRVNDEAGDTTPFVIDASGNVGIGTATPGYRVDAAGDINASGDYRIGGIEVIKRMSGPFGGSESNLFVGTGESMASLNTGSASRNVAVGTNAGRSIVSGGLNTFVGYAAGESTTASQNTFVGNHAAYSNSIGSENTAMGTEVLSALTTGTANSALGAFALTHNTTGGSNIAIGYYSAGSGGAVNGDMDNNVVIGYEAGRLMEGGTPGNGSNNNILIGHRTGDTITTGDQNLLLGYDIDAPTATTSNFMSLGNIIFATGVDGTGTTVSSGSVGIGTTTPGTILDAAGAITSRPSGTGTGQTGQLIMRELAAGGSETATIRAPDALGASYALTLPVDDGTSGQVLSTDGNGILSWIAPGSTITADSLNFTDLADALVLDASTDISVGTNILSVTNDGVGNSFVVNDNGSGDTTPFVIDASGNVGIGLATPYNPLTVQTSLPTGMGASIVNNRSAANFYPTLQLARVRADATQPVAGFGTGLEIWAESTINGNSDVIGSFAAAWETNPTSGPNRNSYLTFGNTTASVFSEKMRITSSGNVGVGTTIPSTLLDIAGAITSRPNGTGTGQTGQLMLRELAASPGGSDTVTIRAPDSVTTSFNLTLPGTAGSTGQVLQTDGTGILSWINAASSVADDSLNFDKLSDALALDANTDIGLDGAEILSITNIGTANSFVVNDQAGDTSPFVIDTNGNVGIGTTTAGSKLEVNGRIVSSLVTDADALTSVTVDFSAANVIDATGASAACGTLNITNTVSGGSFTVTIPNATATCTTIQWNGSATGVKLPAGYAGGIASAGLVYSFVHSGSLLWVTNVTY